jgi:5-bromo-4-chloroindolyl phosphate hydrolysis protein
MTKPNPQTDIALIKSDIAYIKGDIGDIKESFKSINSTFASKEELKDVAKETEIRLSIIEQTLQGPKRFITPIFTAVLTATVTFLVIQYFEHAGV